MTVETKPAEQAKQKPKGTYTTGASEAVYGLGLIGACVYYFTHAATFWIGVLGFLKALVWPALLVYEVLKYFNM